MKLTAAALLAAVAVVQPAELVTRDVYLMGTRAHLSTYASSRTAGMARLEGALRVLEEAEQELSTWRTDSAISALNRSPVGRPWQASERVCRMLSSVFGSYRMTNGTFDPGVGRLIEAWGIHGNGAIPTDAALSRARAASGLEHFTFERERCILVRRAEATLDVGAFGKGEALDRVHDLAIPDPWMIDLGGQISVGGSRPPAGAWTVAVAHPLRRDEPHLHVRMTAGSLSTSAGSERDQLVNGRRVGHILDPRTGQPAGFTGSVTVWHQRGLDADALSTALYVTGPDEGMRWAEERGVAALYLIPGNGVSRRMTAAFAPLVIAPE